MFDETNKNENPENTNPSANDELHFPVEPQENSEATEATSFSNIEDVTVTPSAVETPAVEVPAYAPPVSEAFLGG